MITYLLSLLLLSIITNINIHAGSLIKLYNASNVTIDVLSAGSIKLVPQQSGDFKSTYQYVDPITKESCFSFRIEPAGHPKYEWIYEKKAFKNIKDPIVVLYENYALTLSGKEAHAIMEQQKPKVVHHGAPGGPAFPQEEEKKSIAAEVEEFYD